MKPYVSDEFSDLVKEMVREEYGRARQTVEAMKPSPPEPKGYSRPALTPRDIERAARFITQADRYVPTKARGDGGSSFKEVRKRCG